MRQKAVWMMLVLLMLAVLAACSSDKSGQQTEGDELPPGNNEGQGPQEEQLNPVTLRILPQNSINSDELFHMLYTEPIKSRYPHITVERVQLAQGQNIEMLVASGNVPDVIGVWNGQLRQFKDQQLIEDLQPFADKFSTDLSKFQPVLLEAVRIDGILSSLPYAQNFNALYYNKDIFERFGAAYPEAGMTWQDAIQLARQLTRTDDGVDYRGLDPEAYQRLAFQRSINFIDVETNRANVNNDSMRKVMQTIRDIYSIPGNMPNHPLNQNQSTNAFIGNRNVAMYGTVNILTRLIQVSDLNWGITQYPSFDDLPDQSGMVDAHVHFITASSSHKDDAYRLIEWITSEQVQSMMVSDMANFTVLNNPQIQERFGSHIPELQGIDFTNVFKSTPAPPRHNHELFVQARNLLANKTLQMLNGDLDVNSLLREAEEEINQLIRSAN